MALRKLIIIFSLLSLGYLPPVFAQSPQNIKLLDTFQSKDWTTHIYNSNGKKICFAASEPKSTEPANVRRGKIVFYISTWPSDKVRNEISVKIGYPFKPDSQTIAEIGEQTFTFFVKGDKAFIASPVEENRLVQAIKAGSVMVIKGTSARGTITTDQYSLSGVSAALNKITQDCP